MSSGVDDVDGLVGVLERGGRDVAMLGEPALVDRLQQIAAKFLFVAPSYTYNGKHIDLEAKLQKLSVQLPTIETIVTII